MLWCWIKNRNQFASFTAAYILFSCTRMASNTYHNHQSKGENINIWQIFHLSSQLFTVSPQFSPFPVFCCNAALRTTRGSPYVCLYVRMSVSFSFFAIYSKNLQSTHTSKFVILWIFLLMPLWKKKNKKSSVRGPIYIKAG